MTEKEKFLRKFNQAFLEKDLDFIFNNMTDDVRWEMVGDAIFTNKEDARKAMESMPDMEMHSFDVKSVITHGRDAAAHGTMSMTHENGETKYYAFCDVYKFSGFKDPKIKELTSFVVEMKDGEKD